MKVKISGFRCHINSEYKIEEGKILLLKGPSGCGKTSILQAISWCLYGGKKNVINNTNITNKCNVTIEYRNYIISRQKNPTKLTININNDRIEEDKVAQEIIDSIFGNKEIWLSSSYIEQGEKNKLLTSNISERLDLLTKLTFNNDDPEILITRIDKELETINKIYQEKCIEYKILKSEFDKEYQNKILNESDYISKEEYDNLKLKYDDINNIKTELENKKYEQQKIKGMFISLNEELINVNDKLSKIELFSEEDIKTTESEIKLLEEKLNNIKQYQEKLAIKKSIESDLIKYQNDLYNLDPTYKNLLNKYQESDIWKIKDEEKRYNDNENKCKLYGYEYNEQYIKNKISELQNEFENAINYEKNLNIKKTISELQSEIDTKLKSISEIETQIKQYEDNIFSINQYLSSITIEDIDLLNNMIKCKQDEYNKLLKSNELLECPHCNKSIKFYNNKLIASNDHKISDEQLSIKQSEINTLLHQQSSIKVKIDEKNKYISLNSQYSSSLSHLNIIKSERINYINNLKEKLSSFTSNYDIDIQPSQKSTSQLKSALNILSTIQFIPKPLYSSSFISKLIEYNKLLSKLSLYKDIDDNTYINNNIIDDLNILKIKYSYQLKNYHLFLNLNEQKNSIQLKLNSLIFDNDIDQKYQNILNTLDILDKKIKYLSDLYLMLDKKNKLIQTENDMNLYFIHLSILQKLKHNSINVSYKQLEHTVNSINSLLSDIFTHIFDDPINITLQLFKPIKSDNRLKPNINLLISYKGAEYDNINLLSGGESSRINLGITLALNKLSSSPFLFLDECLEALDAPLREQCINTIRKYFDSSKTVLIICHETIEGHFDSIISV